MSRNKTKRKRKPRFKHGYCAYLTYNKQCCKKAIEGEHFCEKHGAKCYNKRGGIKKSCKKRWNFSTARKRSRRRKGGDPRKLYNAWERRQKGKRRRDIKRRDQKREKMVEDLSLKIQTTKATARALLEREKWSPFMALQLWYESYPEKDPSWEAVLDPVTGSYVFPDTNTNSNAPPLPKYVGSDSAD